MGRQCGDARILDVWEAENVEPVKQSEESREPERLAAMCREMQFGVGSASNTWSRQPGRLSAKVARSLGGRRARNREAGN